ncbi:Unknown protein, partial [Striga hermonthica]
YRLELPESSQIHPVIHVSQLKRSLGEAQKYCEELPTTATDGRAIIRPKQAIEYRKVKRAGRYRWEVLVDWEELPPEEATWEDLEEIRGQFPNFILEDKESLEGDGNDAEGARQLKNAASRAYHVRRRQARATAEVRVLEWSARETGVDTLHADVRAPTSPASHSCAHAHAVRPSTTDPRVPPVSEVRSSIAQPRAPAMPRVPPTSSPSPATPLPTRIRRPPVSLVLARPSRVSPQLANHRAPAPANPRPTRPWLLDASQPPAPVPCTPAAPVGCSSGARVSSCSVHPRASQADARHSLISRSPSIFLSQGYGTHFRIIPLLFETFL